MESLLARISAVLRATLGALLIAAVLLNCLNIFLRYFFNTSYLPADELQVFAMVAITFLGTIAISAENQHLRMDVVTHAASAGIKRLLGILEALVTGLVSGTMTWYSFLFVQRIVAIDQRSGMADLPMWLPHGTVTICFGALTVLACIRLFSLILNRNEKK